MKLENLTKISQGKNGEFSFWQTSVNIKDLLGKFDINRIADNPANGVQRHLNDARAREIALFCERDDAIFPTAIIVSLNSDLVAEDGKSLSDIENSTFLKELSIDSSFGKDFGDIKPFSIIDGQHRLSGLQRYYDNNPSPIKDFHLPLNIYIDADQAKSASIFVTINHNQRSVDSSVINNLFGIIYNGNPDSWTVESFSSRVVDILDTSEYSPFNSAIKKYGKKTSPNQFISQGTLAKKIQINTSANPHEDNLLLEQNRELPSKKNKIFRDYLSRNEAAPVAQILIEYFSAFKFTFEESWSSDDLLIRKAVGFSALMKFLSETYSLCQDSRRSVFDYYRKIFTEKFDVEEINILFSKDKGSSESVANKIAAEMMEISNLSTSA